MMSVADDTTPPSTAGEEPHAAGSGNVFANLQTRLFTALSGVTAGALLTACAVGKLFVYRDQHDSEHYRAVALYLGAGLLFLLPSLYLTLRLLQGLRPTKDECIRYGRHIFGLTFVMLVVGLCNAAVASMLAIDGELTASATALIDASDPLLAKKADERSAEAEAKEKRLAKAVRSKELDHGVALERALRICGTPGTAGCEAAQDAERSLRDDIDRFKLDLDEAHEELWVGKHECEDRRGRSRRALFFLLTMSTMTALLGASFYVVNCVRRLRPQLTGDSDAESSQGKSNAGVEGKPPSAPSARAGERALAASAGAPAPASDASSEATSPREAFDVHKFWSGAFFRIGEAVLFTFAFFWLIWTSENSKQVIWLPVLALFVGMFVKAGEAIIFSLGMRVLWAVEALFPAGAPPKSDRDRPVPSAAQ